MVLVVLFKSLVTVGIVDDNIQLIYKRYFTFKKSLRILKIVNNDKSIFNIKPYCIDSTKNKRSTYLRCNLDMCTASAQ